MALAGLQFIDRAEAVHLIASARHRQDPSQPAALYVRGGESRPQRLRHFVSLARHRRLARQGRTRGRALREKTRYFAASPCSLSMKSATSRSSSARGNLFFQLVNACYERGAHDPHPELVASPSGATSSATPVVATALLDRLLHHAVVLQIEWSSYACASTLHLCARTHQDQSQHPDLAYPVHTKTSRKAAQ